MYALKPTSANGRAIVRCSGPSLRGGSSCRDVRVTVSKTKIGEYLLGGRLARDVDAGADVRVEPLVPEELVLLGDGQALLAHMEARRRAGGLSVDDDRLVAVLVPLVPAPKSTWVLR